MYIWIMTVTEIDSEMDPFERIVGVFTSVDEIEIELCSQGFSLENDFKCDYSCGVLDLAFHKTKDITIERWMPNELQDITYL